MNLTEDQILTLAPDDSSKKSGKDLANPARWVSKGISGRAIWGECQGSGSKPYQTQADLINLAFKCSCPSRKFPCKHGLGLLLLSARQPAAFENTEEPAWVSDWINQRAGKEEQAAAKKESTKATDEAGQQKRQQTRQQRVKDGSAELLLWIKDIIRNGIIQVPDKPPAFWENMARRMVDAQAPGLAGMVRALGETPFFQDGWHSIFLDQLLRIYLVITGFQNQPGNDPAAGNASSDPQGDATPEALASGASAANGQTPSGQAAPAGSISDDLSSLIGFTVNQESLKETPGILDDWLVLAKQSKEDQGLVTERFWLTGASTGQTALLLQFIARGQYAALSLTPGMNIRAELVFFPSANPLRALIKRQVATAQKTEYFSYADWDNVLRNETRIASTLPFYSERPYIVRQLTPVWHARQWWLKDQHQRLMPVRQVSETIWNVLTYSGGLPLDMAVLGKENTFEPIGVWHNNHYKTV